MTFVFVGNFKVEEMKALCEKYLEVVCQLKTTMKPGKIWVCVLPSGMMKKLSRKGVEPNHQLFRYSMPLNTPIQPARGECTDELVNIRLKVLREDKSMRLWKSCVHLQNIIQQSLDYQFGFSCAPTNVDMLIKAAQDVIEEVKNKTDENLVKLRDCSSREKTGLQEMVSS